MSWPWMIRLRCDAKSKEPHRIEVNADLSYNMLDHQTLGYYLALRDLGGEWPPCVHILMQLRESLKNADGRGRLLEYISTYHELEPMDPSSMSVLLNMITHERYYPELGLKRHGRWRPKL